MIVKDQVHEITEKLEEGIKKLQNSEEFKKTLETFAKFPHYSFGNCILIKEQMPTATYVASYKSWQANFNRSVNRNEHGLKIWAPAPYKTEKEQECRDPNGNVIRGADGQPQMEKVTVTVPFFKPVYVFDVSQTSGEPLPEICHKLTGDVEGYENFREALERISPVPVFYEGFNSSANGYFSKTENKIVIKEGMSQEQTIKTLIHEVTHSILHNPDNFLGEAKDKYTVETEAEACSYTVAMRYGIDSSSYSFGYLSSWASGKELPELKASMEVIRQTSRDMIRNIDRELDSIRMEHTNQMAYKLDDGFLLIDRTSTGYECNLLDKEYKEVSVDKIDGSEKRIDYAADAYLKDKGISIVKNECAYSPLLAERDVQMEQQQLMSFNHSHGRY